MTHAEMVRGLVKPGKEIIQSLKPEDANLWHLATGVAGETGELLDAIIAWAIEKKHLDRVNIVEELGDLEFYLEGIRQELEIGREDGTVPVLMSLGRKQAALHFSNRISVQGSELLDAIKKQVIYRRILDREEILSTLQRMENAMAALRAILGITRAECLDANIVKLGHRYKGHQYTDQQAQDRADKNPS